MLLIPNSSSFVYLGNYKTVKFFLDLAGVERRSTPWWPLTFCKDLNRCTLRSTEASCIHWIKKKKKEMETLSRNYKITRNWTDLAFYQRLWSLRRVDMLIFIQSESNDKSNCDSTMIATARGVTDALYGSKISCVIFHWMHVSVKTESKRYFLTRPLRTHSGFYFGGGRKGSGSANELV